MNEKQKSKKSDVMLKFFLNPEIGIMIPILLVCVITTILKPNFLTWSYISSILAGSVFIGAATLGECLIIMSGEIDLSVGMNGCFAGIMIAASCSLYPGLLTDRCGGRTAQWILRMPFGIKQLDNHPGYSVYLSGIGGYGQPGGANFNYVPEHRGVYQSQAFGIKLAVLYFHCINCFAGYSDTQNAVWIFSPLRGGKSGCVRNGWLECQAH